MFKGWAITMGIGAAVGAVAVMMLPKDCTVRRLANRAAYKAEDAVTEMKDKIENKLNI